MARDVAYTDEYFQIIQDADGDIASRRAAFAYMMASTAIVHHQVVASTFVPKLFSQEVYDLMRTSAEMTHAILCKVMQRYLDDPAYRELFDFDERLRELILLPRGYDSLIPFARVDTFIDEDALTLAFCEFNGDGSAGMNENREITNSIKDSETLRTFAQAHKVCGCDLFEPWVDAFCRIYDTYVHKVDSPRFAICDYLENGVVDEFHVFADLFRARGIACEVCDVRELTFNGDQLLSPTGHEINAIWRRCVTNDVIDHWSESLDLIDAVRHEKVALIGSFAGHIIHDKQIFDVLMKPETTSMLTADEISFLEQTIPQTAFLDEAEVNLAQIRQNKDQWIIKPADHYGADEVHAGLECTQEAWEELIGRFANSASGTPFIVQRYIRPYKSKTLPPDTGILEMPDGEISDVPVLYNNLNGLYLYDGHFQGVFSRLGPHPTICKQNDGMTAATIWVDANVQDGLEL